MRRKTAVLGVLSALLAFAALPAMSGAAPNESYNYDFFQNADPAPPAYMPESIWEGDLKDPEDLHAGPDGKIYIADTGNDRIVVLNEDWSVYGTLSEFMNGGEPDRLSGPRGVFVTADNRLYVADTQNGRIVEFDERLEFVRAIGAPESDILRKEFTYIPSKVAVDRTGRIFVVGPGMYDGIVEFDAQGKFDSFIGVNKVNPFTRISDLFWRRIMTREQRAKMALFIPSEFLNIDLNEQGFIYTVNGLNSDSPLGIYNANGVDIMKTGRAKPVGDYADNGTNGGKSTFADIAVNGRGFYSAVETARGRIFTYDREGRLMSIYSRSGDTQGAFKHPAAIDYWNDRLIVLDKALGRVTVLGKTEYGELIEQAVGLYEEGKFKEAAEVWKKVSRLNANFEPAYAGIGKALLGEGDAKEAMKYFKLANDREQYSNAFKKYRKEVLRNVFGRVMNILLLAAAAVFVYRKFSALRRRVRGEEHEANA